MDKRTPEFLIASQAAEPKNQKLEQSEGYDVLVQYVPQKFEQADASEG
jgi:hypothetical protein